METYNPDRERMRHVPLVSLAIYVGTSSAAVLYSFKHGTDRSSCYALRFMSKDETLSETAPMCILFDEDGHFLSFGYDAWAAFNEFEEDRRKKVYYFEKFGSDVFYEQTRDEKMLTGKNGKQLPVVFVLSCLVKNLVQKLEASDWCAWRLTSKEICYVLLVPAGSTQYSRQLLRKAAGQVGINEETVYVMKESEAASLYCQGFVSERYSKPDVGVQIKQSDSHVVLQIQDGAVDATLYEKQSGGYFRETSYSGDQGEGITCLDNAVMQLLTKLLGAKVVQIFCDNHPDERRLLREDLKVKRVRGAAFESRIAFRLPFSLSQLYQAETGQSVGEAINKSPYKDHLKMMSGPMLSIQGPVLKKMMQDLSERPIGHLKKVLQDKDTNFVLLIGETALVETELQAFYRGSSVHTFAPRNEHFAVACAVGHEQGKKLPSVAKYSYGILVQLVENNFQTIIETGERLRPGAYKNSVVCVYGRNLQIYASSRDKPKYINENDIHIGSLKVRDQSDGPIDVAVRMTFKGSAVLVEAMVWSSCKKFRGLFECP